MSRLRFAVIGKPVAHSASPAVHNAAYAAMDLDARMIAVETDDARETILRLRDEGYSGLAVTIPHKEAALAVADGATPTARAAGAANTIVFAAGRIAAENTDVAGIARALASEGISFAGRRVAILGAGGTARAAAAAAIEGSAAGVVFIARTPDRARRLVADMRLLASIDDVEIVDAADDVSEAITRVEILINTTPVGLTDPDATPLEPKALHAQLAVLDAIYRPASTRLLRDALAAGAIAIPGTRMFLAQAAAQIRAFAARDAPMDAMREALMAIPGCEWV